jgi:hypothetical protein
VRVVDRLSLIVNRRPFTDDSLSIITDGYHFVPPQKVVIVIER